MLIVDTGFWLGAFDRDDHYHGLCRDYLKSLRGDLITTVPVLTETTHLILARLNAEVMLRFLGFLEAMRRQGKFHVFSLHAGHLPRITDLMSRYRQLPMDLADASLAILAEHLGHGRILSTDRRDFAAYRWKNHHPFVNLLLGDA